MPVPTPITFLSIPSPAKTLRSGAELVRQRLDRERLDRWFGRARIKRAARDVRVKAMSLAARPVSAVLHKFSRLLRSLFKARRSAAAVRTSAALARIVGHLEARVLRSRAFAAMGSALRTALKRLRALLPTKLRASLSFVSNTKGKRRRQIRGLLYCVARTVALAARVRRRRRRQELAPQYAAVFVAAVTETAVAALATRILAHRDLQQKRTRVATIERAWFTWRARRLDRTRRTQSFTALLSSAHEHLVVAEAHHRLVQSVTADAAESTVAAVARELARRRAAALIQRVWRGSRARARVYALLSAKNQRAFLRRQRERVRRARAALLSGSPQDLIHQKTIAMRVAARREHSTSVRNPHALRRTKARCRHSVLDPVHPHHPPRVSAVTGARVLTVTLAEFEKLQARRARVNPLNLWVAIPVGYDELPPPASCFVKASFDWVPATLLLLNSSQASV